ncbi:protein SMIM45 isoform X1 [Corvus hawaiiensis]|uniref:protein SMIM45 isoform X1 n=1 Tax=Corvus hawaiiensis TaxID=134902 RepID=UPI002019927F|nr:protein SMIM45 isoform X1 [Corvus hawaiiensis]
MPEGAVSSHRPAPVEEGQPFSGPTSHPAGQGSWKGKSAAPAMPHFLDWFVPVYLVISILILVGFGACIYYFEPGLQEAHKWRTQRPIMERDLRKTLMIRDNLAFGVPEV